MSKKKQIQTKLNKLQALIEQIIEVQVIDPHEPETWDSDTLYDLAEKCKAVIKLLEDQTNHSRYGLSVLSTETGLCSLVDEYQEKQAEEEYYD